MKFQQHIKGHQKRYSRLAAIIAPAAIAISGLAVSGAAQAAANAPSHASSAIAAEAGSAAAAQVPAGHHPVQAHQMAVAGRAGPKAVLSVLQAASSYHICLTNALSLCLQSNGTGNQVTITTNAADWSNFHTVRTRAIGKDTEGQIQNGNGNCLRAGTGNVVKIENGPCAFSDPADWWIGPPGNLLESEQYPADYMLVHGNVSGFNVWHANPVSGDWTQWSQVPST
jgi:hypothetical protein